MKQEYQRKLETYELENKGVEQSQRKDNPPNQVRRELKDELQSRIDEQIQERECRFAHAVQTKDTARIWDLVVVATVQANIILH